MTTSIEWVQGADGQRGDTWNPLSGCREISPGCTNCYAAVMASRLEAMMVEKYQGTTRKLDNGKVVWTGKINLDEASLLKPLRTKKPTTYFVNSMSDLFHEDVPDSFIDRVFAVMALCPQHTFQVLTKREERMQQYFSTYRKSGIAPSLSVTFKDMPDGGTLIAPLDNVWLGVSVEDQQRASERILFLLRTPAAVRFLSCEPLLGSVNIEPFLQYEPFHENYKMTFGAREWRGVDWVIVGGESGHGARPCRIEWVRSIVEQCQAAAVPVFVKQLGSHVIGNMSERMAMIGEPVNRGDDSIVRWKLRDKKGGDMAEWPQYLRVRQFPEQKASVTG